MKKISLFIIVAIIVALSALTWYKAAKRSFPVPSSDIDTIIVGTNAEFQPFSFKEDDANTGVDIDIITTILNRLKIKMIIKDMPFEVLLPEIQLGNIHGIAARITPTTERTKPAFFTYPHLTSDFLVIISHKD